MLDVMSTTTNKSSTCHHPPSLPRRTLYRTFGDRQQETAEVPGDRSEEPCPSARTRQVPSWKRLMTDLMRRPVLSVPFVQHRMYVAWNTGAQVLSCRNVTIPCMKLATDLKRRPAMRVPSVHHRMYIVWSLGYSCAIGIPITHTFCGVVGDRPDSDPSHRHPQLVDTSSHRQCMEGRLLELATPDFWTSTVVSTLHPTADRPQFHWKRTATPFHQFLPAADNRRRRGDQVVSQV